MSGSKKRDLGKISQFGLFWQLQKTCTILKWKESQAEWHMCVIPAVQQAEAREAQAEDSWGNLKELCLKIELN